MKFENNMQYKLSLEEQFKYRPKPFFFLTTCDKNEYTDEKVRQSLIDLKGCGFGGLVLFNKPPKGFNRENYLKDEWFSMVEKFCKYSKELGLTLWINDGFDYPPGNVAGRVYDIDSTVCQKHIVNENGKLVIKDADWGFPAWESKRANEIYQTLVYEEYKKHVGKYFGNTIVGFFTDGDNRRVLPPAMFNENHPCRNYFPWADNFERDFKEKYGYDILPFMFDIIDRKAISQANDYWEFAGLCYQRWIKSNANWMHNNGLLYTGHTSDSAPYLYDMSSRSSALTEGRFSDIQSNFDYPGTDQELLAIDGGKHMSSSTWYSPDEIYGEPIVNEKMIGYADISTDTRAKQTASTAFIYNKKEVMCEMFAASNYGVAPVELRQIFAYQAMQGVTMVVPHAYHYRYFGATKYFAPPEFSKRGLIGEYINEFNDNMARICAMLSKGTPIYPICLLDPTEGVWQNNIDYKEYTSTFAKLNRLPQGFIICNYDKIINGNFNFKVVVVSGINLSEDKILTLKERGIVVLNSTSLSEIEKYVASPVEYNADGHLMFARRIIDDEEFIFISNIENKHEVNVTLTAFNKHKEFKLYAGEIRYISKNYDDIIEDKSEKILLDSINIAEVKFDRPNYIQLETFLSNGKTTVKSDDVKDIEFNFTSMDNLSNINIFIPSRCFENNISKILFDDICLDSVDTFVYDDRYKKFNIKEIFVGKHTIKICKTAPINSYDRIFMQGDFDVNITTNKTFYKAILSVYNFNTYIAEKSEIVLSKRSNKLLTNKSWAEQGQPFYSGKTTYHFNYEFIEDGSYLIELGDIRDVAEVSVNEKYIGRKIYPPYLFNFEVKKGTLPISITITNTLGNEMECYLEKSGLTDSIKIKKVAK